VDLALTLVAIAATVILVGRLCEPLGLPLPWRCSGWGWRRPMSPACRPSRCRRRWCCSGFSHHLLYAAALNTSLIDLRKLLTPILGLSVGLVLFTALGVALVASWLLPISFAVAFALGAIVAPPDAVATTAVARRIGLPRRTTTVLEGESLLNDATALVSLRTAVAAAGLAAHGAGHAGDVTTLSVVLDFARAVAGGLIVGWLVFVAVGSCAAT
jgi:NhaP-type Na+/H+ or K+/H+ antiporter